MTEEEAVRLLWVERVFARMVDGSEFVLLKPTDAKKISELLGQQAGEIAKRDRMIERACDRLSNFRKCPPEVCDLPYHPGDVECCKHWRKWLEKEAEGEAK